MTEQAILKTATENPKLSALQILLWPKILLDKDKSPAEIVALVFGFALTLFLLIQLNDSSFCDQQAKAFLNISAILVIHSFSILPTIVANDCNIKLFAMGALLLDFAMLGAEAAACLPVLVQQIYLALSK